MKCLYCSIEFSSHKEAKYCSRDCANKNNAVTKPRSNCLNCGKKCKRPTTKLCSIECRSAHLAKIHKGRTLNSGRTHLKRTKNLDLTVGYTRSWNGYILYRGRRVHRELMQEVIGRKLEAWEDVHHINGNKEDNSIENLIVLSKREHAKIHARLKKERHGITLA